MKSYLELVSISAKVHKKQSRMSIFCIILAVFLVTTIFGMADMFVRSQIMQSQLEDGNWHVMFRELSDEDAKMISVRPDVKNSSWYGVLNFNGKLGYTLSDKNVIICGSDESFITEMQIDMIEEGTFPQENNEALVTENIKDMLGLKLGDEISIHLSDTTELRLAISGFMKNTSKLMSEDSYGVFLPTESFRSIYSENIDGEPSNYNSVFYVQFSNVGKIQNAISDIALQFNLEEEQISENTKLLGLLGQSGNSFMMQVYGVAIILFLLVLVAGIIMIASSLNSNVAQRTEFFGMIRCIGATSKQIMRLVRREALRWCGLAIPIGIAGGIVVVWGLCFALRYLVPEYFAAMPVFSISYLSIIAGVCVGVLTVILAARSPAKKASKVSPLTAVSGNANNMQPVRMAVDINWFKIDSALGIHHAKASKKNFILMVGSFSLSIILFLSFSVTIDFMNHTITPIHPWTADISIISPDYSCSVDNGLIDEIQKNPAVKSVYGRKFAYNVPILVNGEEQTVDIISYEDKQFEWAEDYMLDGSLDTVQNEKQTGLIVFKPQNTIKVGDTITLNNTEYAGNIGIVGLLSESPFNNAADVGTVICSEETFQLLTGQSDYTIIDIQLLKTATDNDVNAIHKLVGTEYTFSDERMGNSSALGTYYCFTIFVYGFLTLIALITIFNVVNSISMSVAARMKQYGAFRAIGVSERQLVKMITAEALTYTLTGCVCGSILGLILNKFLFEKLVSFQWGEQWKMPIIQLAIIIAVVAVSVLLAVREPAKKIRNMSIVDMIDLQ